VCAVALCAVCRSVCGDQAFNEVIIFFNERHPDGEALVESFRTPNMNLKILGDANNHGITWALNWLIGNATNEIVLFLEKDFKLVESLDCVHEQVEAGVSMLQVGCPVGGHGADCFASFPVSSSVRRIMLRTLFGTDRATSLASPTGRRSCSKGKKTRYSNGSRTFTAIVSTGLPIPRSVGRSISGRATPA
jgi:hypothetical protein